MLVDMPPYRRVPGYEREGTFDRFKRCLMAGKPRIVRTGGRWTCMAQTYIGFGSTPFDAFLDWRSRCRN